MHKLNRRAFVRGTVATGFAAGLAGCQTTTPLPPVAQITPPPVDKPVVVAGKLPTTFDYPAIYGPVAGDRFPVPAVKLSLIDPAFLRKSVPYETKEPVGTIIVDTPHRYLYLVADGGQAMRYGVGVGREGFGWAGEAFIKNKQEWPDWYPPKEMIERQPELKKIVTNLQSGVGLPGGPRNPLGARAMYLWQGNADTLFRIHGTLEPWTIGKNVSSGCIRMINQDAMDLYSRVPAGTRVVVLGTPALASRPKTTKPAAAPKISASPVPPPDFPV